MGQQQLLFIVLGIILVGLAIFVGINLFTSNAVEAKRNNLINECINLASVAQQYYRRPVAIGGGGRSFNNWQMPSQLSQTQNGRYIETVYGDSIVIRAIGNEVVTGTDSVEVRFTILANDYRTVVIH